MSTSETRDDNSMSMLAIEKALHADEVREYTAARLAVEKYFADKTKVDGSQLSRVVDDISDANDVSPRAVAGNIYRLIEEDVLSYQTI